MPTNSQHQMQYPMVIQIGNAASVVRRSVSEALTWRSRIRTERRRASKLTCVASETDYIHQFLFLTPQMKQRQPPNHAMERTADRSEFTFEMSSTLPVRATRALIRRRSSYSR